MFNIERRYRNQIIIITIAARAVIAADQFLGYTLHPAGTLNNKI